MHEMDPSTYPGADSWTIAVGSRQADITVGQVVKRIFELVEGNLSTEKQKDISDITRRFAAVNDYEAWTVRVAKAIALLEFIRDLPRTEKNCAAMLVDEVGKPAPVEKVTEALRMLV